MQWLFVVSEFNHFDVGRMTMSVTQPSPLYSGTMAVSLGGDVTILVPPGSAMTKVHVINVGEREVHVVYDKGPGHNAWNNHITLFRGDSLLIESDDVGVRNSVGLNETGAGAVGVFMYRIEEPA
ncbi:hypothetical protein [Mesobacterium pallidum]|uniref:hypothetical protein n=1 Tax=Mesobacterium pallidum TaxID=2872037 RepID=UPI001EE1F3CF|nr:hypothetical protein [Mesobacterium pallidum]